MAFFQARQLAEMGYDVTLYAAPGSRAPAGVTLVMPEDAEPTLDGERALALAAYDAHRRNPYLVFIDNGHTHILSAIYPRLPVINVCHDIYQTPDRCPVLVSDGQRALMTGDIGARARVIHNLVEPPSKPILNLRPSEPPYVLFMGAFMNYKQPMLAICAAARCGVKIVLAGRGSEVIKPILSGWENIEVRGPVSGDERWSLLANARLLLQLGHSEAFGLTTVEANLCGTPVVAWAAGGSLDIIQNGVNGVFCPCNRRR
ncbi:MAG: hypothetical protein KatS3mg038_1008 [Candidatus Kapaibacterium sp.]|nr:MAG: hypothetical protein KatS3mg038_1008 [Candidatus Kapabacteria bacterium]